MEIRTAVESGLSAMVELIEARRRAYEVHQPVSWKKAANSASETLTFFASPLSDEATAVLAASDAGRLRGFLIAQPMRTPPVYDPGGPTVLIDDFCVADPSLWPSLGRALLDRARDEGHAAGWRQIVVCGHADQPKAEFLRSAALSPASTWWTEAL